MSEQGAEQGWQGSSEASTAEQAEGEVQGEVQGGLRMPRSSVFGSVINAYDYLQLAAAADYHDEAAPSPLRKAVRVASYYIPFIHPVYTPLYTPSYSRTYTYYDVYPLYMYIHHMHT